MQSSIVSLFVTFRGSTCDLAALMMRMGFGSPWPCFVSSPFWVWGCFPCSFHPSAILVWGGYPSPYSVQGPVGVCLGGMSCLFSFTLPRTSPSRGWREVNQTTLSSMG